MRIPEKIIKDMLFWVTKDRMCEDCKQNEKNSGFYSKYKAVIYSDIDDYELVDKDELEELREQVNES